MEDSTGDGPTEHQDAFSYNFEDWIAVVRGRHRWPAKEYIVITFPNDEIRRKYLQLASEREEEEVRSILATFLGGSRAAHELDRIHLLGLKWRFANSESQIAEGWRRIFRDYERRALLELTGKTSEPTWPGLTWILDLLPDAPAEALAVIRGFMTAHLEVLPDLRLSGLLDAEELIRTRYILRGSSSPEVVLELLLSLSSREFEFFVARVFSAMGYQTTVTPAQKDRGKDVVAAKGNELLYIECKNWRGRVDSDVVAGLTGRVEIARVTQGIVVGTSGFTSGPASAEEVAAASPSRMRLISGAQLIVMCNEHLGSEWHRRIAREIEVARAGPS